MRSFLSFVACLIVLGSAACGAAAAAGLRITNDGRSVLGAFSPDGSRVAYVSLSKRFTSDGKSYFLHRIRLWDGRRSRELAVLPNGKPSWGEPNIEIGTPYWLDSGQYVYLPGAYAHTVQVGGVGSLLRAADGKLAKVYRRKGKFVLNKSWRLSPADTKALNTHLKGLMVVRLGNVNTGRWLDVRRLPRVVPRESKSWQYQHFLQSPTDSSMAAYIAADKHFDGCSCTEGRQKTYLGVADLRTGRIRRLTRSLDFHLIPAHISWSPDGRLIAYLREGISDIDSPSTWSALHVIGPDGRGDRRLVRNIGSYRWLDSRRIAIVRRDGPYRSRKPASAQISIVELGTGHIRRLTAGRYEHQLVDARGGSYLVVQRPVGRNRCRGDLFILR